MIQSGSFLKTVDNIGIKELKCIRVLGGMKKRTARIGDTVVASVREVKHQKTKKSILKKGDVLKVLLVQTKKQISRLDGQQISFLKNSGVILDKQKKILGSRIAGPACKEFRKKRFFKVTTLSASLV